MVLKNSSSKILKEEGIRLKNPLIAFANNSPLASLDRVQEAERLGYRVAFCQNTVQVLELFGDSVSHDSKPALLITDNFLIHGQEFSESQTRFGTRTGTALYIKLRARFPELPVVVYTTERTAYHDLSVYENMDPFLVAVYDSGTDATEGIFIGVRKLLPIARVP